MHLSKEQKPLNIAFDIIKAQAVSFFNEDHKKIQLVVSPDEQQREINLLRETLGSERFFFVVDLLKFKVTAIHGVQRWLGYSEKEFSLKQYMNDVFHPGHQLSKLLITSQIFEAYCKGKYPLGFMVQRFGSVVPLRHYNGHYLLTKKTSSVFQYDINNRMTAYLNEFTIVGNYQGEALSPRLHTSNGNREVEKEEFILQKVIDSFQNMKVFTDREIQIARKVAYNRGITQAQIAQDLNISVNTVDTYYKRFLSKARNLFDEDFPTAVSAATYLSKEGLF